MNDNLNTGLITARTRWLPWEKEYLAIAQIVILPYHYTALLRIFTNIFPFFIFSLFFTSITVLKAHSWPTPRHKQDVREEKTEKYATDRRAPRRGTLAQLPRPPPVTKYCHRPLSTRPFSTSTDLNDGTQPLAKGSESHALNHGEREVESITSFEENQRASSEQKKKQGEVTSV